MPRPLRLITEPEPCPYGLPKSASFELLLHPSMERAAYEEMLERGWRRFGIQFFRPVCPNCRSCQSLRIPVASFEPNRSQRRALARNRDLEVSVVRPRVDREHLDLYIKYHSDMTVRKGWRLHSEDPDAYASEFAVGARDFGFEFQYRLEGKLIGVALTDVLATCSSSVYTYYDPDLRSRSLGALSILKQIEFSRLQGLTHQYLGYWIPEAPDMAYKQLFRPHEILKESGNSKSAPIWLPNDGPA